MTTFLLIRHGETDAVGKSIMGWRPGWHLNANGRRQVEALAARLAGAPIRAIYTSPLERAVETAEALGKPHGIEPRRDEALGEFHAGDWQGQEIAELDRQDHWRRFNTFRPGTRAPGGELAVEMQARIVGTLETLLAPHRDQMVAVVSHADPLRALIGFFAGAPIVAMLNLEISPASVSVLEWSEYGARLLAVNAFADGIPV